MADAFERLHPRGRDGRWIDKLGIFKLVDFDWLDGGSDHDHRGERFRAVDVVGTDSDPRVIVEKVVPGGGGEIRTVRPKQLERVNQKARLDAPKPRDETRQVVGPKPSADFFGSEVKLLDGSDATPGTRIHHVKTARDGVIVEPARDPKYVIVQFDDDGKKYIRSKRTLKAPGTKAADAAPLVKDPDVPQPDVDVEQPPVVEPAPSLALAEDPLTLYQRGDLHTGGVNDKLWRGVELSESDQRFVEELDASLTPTSVPTTVYRGKDYGYGMEDRPDFKVGDRIDQPAFVSTTRSQSTAKQFATADPSNRHAGVVWEIEVPEGTPTADLPSDESKKGRFHNEEETLLGRGGTLVVTDVSAPDSNDVVRVKARYEHPSQAPEAPPVVEPPASGGVPSVTPGVSTYGGVSTDLEDLELDKDTTKVLRNNMKSKGFTVSEEKQAILQTAKNDALEAIGVKLGYTPEQREAARKKVNEFMSSWYTMGGQSNTRREYEAAWKRLRAGVPEDSDIDRAVLLQKVYTDITWDTREMSGSVQLIRGVSGSYAQRIAIADALGEEWSARTWPLTSWAVPSAEASVRNWADGGVKLDSNATTRDEVLAMYHAEPLLREKGLKVKGEYIVDGQGALDSHDVEVTRFPEKGRDPYAVDPFDRTVERAKRFHEATGGDAEDFFLGELLDEPMSVGVWGYRLTDHQDPDNEYVRRRWNVLGFEEPPASSRDEPVSAYGLPDFNEETKKFIGYDERNRMAEEANVPKRQALARDLKDRGLTAESIGDLLSMWHDYTDSKDEANLQIRRSKKPLDPDANTFDRESGPKIEEGRARMLELAEHYNEKAKRAQKLVEARRAELGLDDVPLRLIPDEPMPGAANQIEFERIRRQREMARDGVDITDGVTTLEAKQMGESLSGVLPSGYTFKTEVDPDSLADPSGGVSFKGEIRDSDGEVIGDYTRWLRITPRVGDDDERVVDNSTFQIYGDMQGQGIGTEFTQYWEDYWIAHDVDRMDVFAASTVGGFAWARAGYQWWHSDNKVRNFALNDGFDRDIDPMTGLQPLAQVNGILRKISEAADGPTVKRIEERRSVPSSTTAQIEAMRVRLEKIRDDAKMTRGLSEQDRFDQLKKILNDLPTPFELSEIGRQPGDTTWAGKEGMLGSAWEGTKPLPPIGEIPVIAAGSWSRNVVALVHDEWAKAWSDRTRPPAPGIGGDASVFHVDLNASAEAMADFDRRMREATRPVLSSAAESLLVAFLTQGDPP